MLPEIQIHNAQRRRSAETVSVIRGRIEAAAAAVDKAHTLPPIDIAVFLTAHGIHPDYLMTGWQNAPDSMVLVINPDSPRSAAEHHDEIFVMTVHELHHCLRAGHHADETLDERLVQEGLALAAERQFGGENATYYADAPSRRVLTAGLKRVAKAPQTDDLAWIYRPARDRRINLVYFLGDAIVRAWLEATGQTAFDAVAVPPMEILRASPALRRYW